MAFVALNHFPSCAVESEVNPQTLIDSATGFSLEDAMAFIWKANNWRMVGNYVDTLNPEGENASVNSEALYWGVEPIPETPLTMSQILCGNGRSEGFYSFTIELLDWVMVVDYSTIYKYQELYYFGVGVGYGGNLFSRTTPPVEPPYAESGTGTFTINGNLYSFPLWSASGTGTIDMEISSSTTTI